MQSKLNTNKTHILKHSKNESNILATLYTFNIQSNSHPRAKYSNFFICNCLLIISEEFRVKRVQYIWHKYRTIHPISCEHAHVKKHFTKILIYNVNKGRRA